MHNGIACKSYVRPSKTFDVAPLRTPVVVVPLVVVPLVAVPLVAVPLVAVPLVAVPLVAVPRSTSSVGAGV
jgi:hypothetical protein